MHLDAGIEVLCYLLPLPHGCCVVGILFRLPKNKVCPHVALHVMFPGAIQ